LNSNSNIILKDAYKSHTIDQDKVIAPEETVKQFREKLKSLDLNILNSVTRIDNGRLDIPVFFSECGHDAKSVIGTNKQMGKGATVHQAEASAIMELAERFSFFSYYKNPKNFFTEKFSNIKDNTIPFEMIAQSVHDESCDLEIAKKIFSNIPLRWTWGYDLTQGRKVLVPFDWFFMINEFNGPSAGNCVEEAVCQGICEIVERHVSSVISQKRIKVPAINLCSATDKMVLEMVGKYKNAGIQIYVSDFSLSMGIPSIGVLAWDLATFPEKSEIVWTAGTAPDPQKALSRALSETAQLSGDFNTGVNYIASGLPKFTDIKQADFIVEADRTVNIQDLPDLSDNNIKIEIDKMVAALKKNSMNVILIDTRHPQLDVPAFYTIIPGAHFRERALGTSVGMFSAKMITQNDTPYEAIKHLNEIEKMMPGKYYTKFYLGSSYLSINDHKKALKYFNEAKDLDPTKQDLSIIYSYMAVCLKDMGQYLQALCVLNKAEKLDKDKTDIYNLMGFCYFKLNKHENAIRCFKKVIKLDPSSGIDYANIGSNYREMGDMENAVKYYKIALKIDPSIEFARENLKKLNINI